MINGEEVGVGEFFEVGNDLGEGWRGIVGSEVGREEEDPDLAILLAIEGAEIGALVEGRKGFEELVAIGEKGADLEVGERGRGDGFCESGKVLWIFRGIF